MTGLKEYLQEFAHLTNFRIIWGELVFTWQGGGILFRIAIEDDQYVIYTDEKPQKRVSEAFEVLEYFSLL